MDKKDKVFWHEAFFEALQLEFHRYQNSLTFEDEYPLSKEALISDTFKEATNMSDAVRDIFFEGAEQYGWLQQDRLDNAIKMAKKMLLLGNPVEKVIEVTELPYETVADLV